MQIVEARPLPRHRLFLRFRNGRSGEVDLSSLKFTGVFAPLRDQRFFSKVSVNPEWGTVMWPNGADMDPYVLYSEATGIPLPAWNSPAAETIAHGPKSKLHAHSRAKNQSSARRAPVRKKPAGKAAARNVTARKANRAP